MLRAALGSRALQLIVGLCVVALLLTRWVAALGGPAAIWERYGILAPAISVPLQTVVATTPLPSDVLWVANGTVYGLWLGACLSWLGGYLAALIEFGTGRRARSDFPVEQSCLPHLRRSRGRIVNIGSGEAFLSTPINSACCMSKHGLEALSESLRMELAPMGVRVVLVEPGGTQTAIMEKVAARFDALADSLPSAARHLYGRSMDARRDMPKRGRLQPAEAVARAVRRALDDARPKPRYFVGADVRGAFLLGRLVPSAVRDAVLRRLFGFPGAAR